MYIIPDTTIRLLKDVPLDNTYDHTVYFTNKTAQINWFADFTKYTLTAQSYQRLQKGKMRVERRAENLYDCNYIMYQNSSFGNKWFYAFITGVEYINNETSEITFQIDVMQTWYFDYTVDQCFIEREHSSTDVAGDNLLDEQLETGEYITDIERFDNTIERTLAIIIATNYYLEDEEDDNPGTQHTVLGGIDGSIFRALAYRAYRIFDDDMNFQENKYRLATQTLTDINERGKGDAVAAVVMAPWFMYSPSLGNASHTTAGHYYFDVPKEVGGLTNFQGYVPRNKKLYTYPYNFLYVTNNSGKDAIYPYEYFMNDSNICRFRISGDSSLNPVVMCTPWYYKGTSFKYNEALTLTNFPQCPFTSDAYKAWLAQNSSTLMLQGASGAVSGLIQGVAGVASQNYAGAVAGLASGITSVLGVMAQISDKANMPNVNKGQSQSAPMLGVKHMGFSFYRKHITAQFARIIDEFFDRYGYKTNRNKVPNHCNTRFTRPKWGYTKTISCSITGSVPADDMAEICGIYDNGITFWRSNATICDYTQDNRIGARVQTSNVGSAVSG